MKLVAHELCSVNVISTNQSQNKTFKNQSITDIDAGKFYQCFIPYGLWKIFFSFNPIKSLIFFTWQNFKIVHSNVISRIIASVTYLLADARDD